MTMGIYTNTIDSAAGISCRALFQGQSPDAQERRESHDAYHTVVARLGERWRVILCRDGLQWIVQRRDGERAGRPRWTGVRYCVTRDGLIAACRTLCLAHEALDALPERAGADE